MSGLMWSTRRSKLSGKTTSHWAVILTVVLPLLVPCAISVTSGWSLTRCFVGVTPRRGSKSFLAATFCVYFARSRKGKPSPLRTIQGKLARPGRSWESAIRKDMPRLMEVRMNWLRFLCVLLLTLLVGEEMTAQSRPRIAIAGISHESNSFNPDLTRLSDFRIRDRSNPSAALQRWKTGNDEVSGFVEEGERLNFDLYPALVSGATPKGPVTDDALNTLMDKMIQLLKEGQPLDGIYLALHGAMVAESYRHGDAEIVRRIREFFGADFPIVVTHDFHANVSPEIVEYATALITYKENPHLDTKERGKQAAQIMAGTVSGKFKPTMALVKPPMLYNILYQNTFAEPLQPIVGESRRLEAEHPEILAVSVSGGYQYADVPAMGPTVVVITNNNPQLAQQEAQRLADMLWETREHLVLDLPAPAEAVRMARESDVAPRVLVDRGGDLGGGSAGARTCLPRRRADRRATGGVWGR